MQNRQQQQGNLPGSVQIFGSGAGTNLCVPGSTAGPFPQANELLKVRFFFLFAETVYFCEIPVTFPGDECS